MTTTTNTSTLYSCLICGAVSPTKRCPDHGGTNTRPSFRQRGYGPEYHRNRKALLAANPVCCVPGCDQPATDAHHDPPRRQLIAMGVENPDDHRAWMKAMCGHHHRILTGFGR